MLGGQISVNPYKVEFASSAEAAPAPAASIFPAMSHTTLPVELL